MILNTLPVFGVAAAIAFLGERITWAQGAGAAVILLAFFLFVNLWDVHPEFAAQKPDQPGGGLDATALQRRVELYDQSVRHADGQLALDFGTGDLDE